MWRGSCFGSAEVGKFWARAARVTGDTGTDGRHAT